MKKRIISFIMTLIMIMAVSANIVNAETSGESFNDFEITYDISGGEEIWQIGDSYIIDIIPIGNYKGALIPKGECSYEILGKDKSGLEVEVTGSTQLWVYAVKRGIYTIRVTYKTGISDDKIKDIVINVDCPTERGFDITRDGWPFRNNYDGFGYLTDEGKSDESYKIPTRIWTDVYGESVNTYIKASQNGNWRGSCFGMCATAYLYYMEQLDSLGEINEIGYDDIRSIRSNGWKRKRYPALNKNSDINNLISQYQVAVGSEEFIKIREEYQFTDDGSYKEMFQRVIEYLQNTRHTLCLEIGWGYDKESEKYSSAHALLVDCSHTPVVEQVNDAWYKIYLYDPNHPHYDNNENLNLPDYYNNWDNRYLSVNISTGEWYYCGSINGDAQEYELHNESGGKIYSGDDAKLYFYDLEGIPNNFDEKLNLLPEDNRFKYYIAATDFSLANDNKILFEVVNGRITKCDNNVEFIPYIEGINTKGINGNVYLPIDNYTIKAIGENNIINLGNNKISSMYLKKGDIVAQIKKNNNIINITANSETDIDIVSGNIYNETKYDYINLVGTLQSNDSVSINNNGNDNYEVESNAKENFEIEHKNNSTKELANISNLSTWDGTYDTTETDMYASSINNTSPYSDISSTDSYFNAVNLLSALDIINGYEDGTFKPNNKVTRAEFTKLVIEALGNNELREAEYSSGRDTKFSDVPGKHWASGYITSGVNNGLIDGMGDGTFAPDANVTYAQAMKILACSAGYSQLSEDAGGWPDGYLKYANEIGIGEGVKESNDTAITRGQVAQMIFNTIQAPVVIIKDLNSKDSDGNRIPTLEKKDGTGENYQSILTKLHEVYTVGGYITEDNKFIVTASINFEDEYYPMDSEKVLENVNIPENYKDTVGVPVTAFIKSDEDSYKLIYMY